MVELQAEMIGCASSLFVFLVFFMGFGLIALFAAAAVGWALSR